MPFKSTTWNTFISPFSNSFTNTFFGLGATLDADAAAYIAAIESTGESVTDTQKASIDHFYVSAKSDGYYSSLKRVYLPIWGAAAPNAIDMISRASGTFNGGVTHSDGVVQGDGSSGYFAFGVSPASESLTLESSCLFHLTYSIGSVTGFRRPIGCENSASQILNLAQSGSLQVFDAYSTSGGRVTASLGNATGIVLGSREGGSRSIYRRNSSGFSTLVSTSGADSGFIPTTIMSAMAHTTSSTVANYSNDEYGAYGMALGLDSTDSQDFTLALKNLWEGCTGLSL